MPKLNLDQPQVMGILNITLDSFSDGGQFINLDAAVSHAKAMVAAGASIIDIGAESTRPGSLPVSAANQIAKLLPVIKTLSAELDVLISIDTASTQVMHAVIAAGVDMINDTRALQDIGAVDLLAQANIPVCLMHMTGTPANMQDNPEYDDVIGEVGAFLLGRIDECVKAGIKPENIIVDPGFGFGKTLEHNLKLLHNLEKIVGLGYPLLVGISRKSMLGAITGQEVNNRLVSGIAAHTIALYKGAKIIRTHDVAETVDAVKIVQACRAAHY